MVTFRRDNRSGNERITITERLPSGDSLSFVKFAEPRYVQAAKAAKLWHEQAPNHVSEPSGNATGTVGF